MTKQVWHALMLAGAVSAQAPGIAGIWLGTLEAGPVKLRIAFHIAADSNGGLTATADSLGQNVLGIPVSQTTLNGSKLHLDMPAMRAQYDGTLSADGMEIAGTFTQGAALPLNLKRVERIEGPNRPQEPKQPFPYESMDAGYDNAGVHLAGTLTVPKGPGPFPAALLISGSGPQDRDETLLGHKPFWVIADYLTRRGIAVLRVDDRGVGKSTGSSTPATLDDMAGDVLAGVAFLKSRKEIDPKHIGVIGHSEGGMVGPLAASKSSDIAFVVMLAGPGVSFQQAIDAHQSQAEAVMRQAGASEDAISWNNAIQSMIIRVLRTQADPGAALLEMRAELDQMKAALPEAQRKAMDTPQASAQMNQQFAALSTPEMRGILLYDPAQALRKLKIPVLALNGSRDVQVLATLNLPAIEAALKQAGNRDFATREMPGLNHLFQTCKACTIAEYGDIEETFAPAGLEAMGDWIVEHSRSK